MDSRILADCRVLSLVWVARLVGSLVVWAASLFPVKVQNSSYENQVNNNLITDLCFA